MADNDPQSCMTCSTGGMCGGKGIATLKRGVWSENPISIQVLGICSALAVTNRLENSLVMGAAVIFTGVCANLLVSLMRGIIPRRIRMIVQVGIIATFVIIFDLFLKAYYWEMSGRLGPYVGLIITNCLLMGRAESFAMQNRPVLSMVDGLGNGLGYTLVLALVGFFRELLGSGTILGATVLSESWYRPNQMMILAPGAFITLGMLIAVFNVLGQGEQEEATT